MASFLDFAKFSAFDELQQLIPFGMRQPNGIRTLADGDTVLGDLDLRAFRAIGAQGEFDTFHFAASLLANTLSIMVCIMRGMSSGFIMPDIIFSIACWKGFRMITS
jgi:hypothetical protein